MRPPKRSYDTEILRISLAKKMVRHEARTRTIQRWCGLTEGRIRELYRSFARDQGSRYAVRHRGPTPRQPGLFLRTTHIRSEAAALAGVYGLLQIIPTRPLANVRRELPTLQRCDQLLRAYESFLSLVGSTEISLEQAVLLLMAVAQGTELRLGHCVQCGAAIVFDPRFARRRSCGRCDAKAPSIEERLAANRSHQDVQEGVQQSLF
jgi:hypothetical protein